MKRLHVDSKKIKNCIVSSNDYLGNLEVRSQVGFLNKHRKHSMQDFATKRHPWHEVGLDGEVLAMDDPVVDTSNCYLFFFTNGIDESSSLTCSPDDIDLRKIKIVQDDDADEKFDFEHGCRAHVVG